MKKTNFFVTLVLTMSILFTALGLYGIKVRAEVPANVGTLEEDASETFPWLKGREEKIKTLFIEAYTSQGWTEEGNSKIVPIAFNNARVGLVQVFGEGNQFEGALFLNEIDGDKVLVVDDPSAFLELQALLTTGDNNTNGILLDIVKSDGKTYYITDRRNEDGIFSMVEDSENPGTMIAEYLPYRIGLGTGTYGDIMWVEYTKAYKFATQYMESLGLPLGAVATYRYVTADLNADGKYTGTSSEKAYTKQEFENGWLIQARMQILTNPETGALGGHQVVQHAAAPIMNDMYALVLGLAGNAELNITGAPVSIEFNVAGVRYQNFEYGYVKVTDGVAEFVVDLVVDELGTPMNRRIGITRTWDNIRTGHADNNGIHAIGWERLRISQNFRNVVGQLIRDGVLSGTLTDGQVVHSGVNAPQDGIWFSFKDAKNPDGTTASYLGAANLFVFHTSWYDTARPLLTYLNTADYVDAKDGIGRPIADYKQIYNVYYQEFKGGIGFYNRNNNQITRVLKADLATWLDGAESIEAALIAKDIAQAAHEVTFKDKDGNIIETVSVVHGEAAVAPAAPVVPHYEFSGWLPSVAVVEKNIETVAQYKPVEYTVTYVLDGGVNHASNPLTANILLDVTLLPATKTDRIFDGWYKDAAFTEAITKLTNITENITVYAKFINDIPLEDILGVMALGTVPSWVEGHELLVKTQFTQAYNEAAFTAIPNDYVQALNFGYARVMLYQVIPGEGALIMNEVNGKVLAVTDLNALLELQALLTTGDNNTNGILLDIVKSDGKTYYITDRRNEDGIFSMVEDSENPGTMIAEYLPYRIGLGTGTYGDIMWVEYTKAYKFATQYMESLGLPLGAVATYRYVTADLNADGKYTGTSSEKAYTKQEFENGWLIQARMQILTNPETGALGGHQVVQHAAAPIMNDMYALVLGLAGNAELNITGAPVSIEFNVAGVRYQNFEYGYVKVTDGVAEFVVDLVVDELGTPMNRRIGITRTWDNIRTGHADNNGIHAIGWERLRISQNFRNVVGQLIRDGVLSGTLTDGQVVHSGVNAPQDGIWFSFKDAKNPDGTTASYLGAANLFVFHTSWYDTARPLLTYLNTADYVDAKDGIGRPIADYKQIYNVYYQEFKGGIGFYNRNNNQITRVLKADLATWLDGAESIEAALIAKGIAQAAHEVTFKDKDGNIIETVSVVHGEAAVAPAAPVVPHYEFSGWLPSVAVVEKNIETVAQYKPVEYTVTYVLDGGVNHASNPLTANILLDVTLLPATKTDRIFDGWYKDAAFTEAITKLTNITENITVYARFIEEVSLEDILGVMALGTVPAWVEGYESLVKTEFTRVYNEAAFTAVPNDYLQTADLGRTRVMLYQVIPGEGAIVMNERDGIAMFTKNLPVITAYIGALGTENASILLGIVEVSGVEYFITDQSILYLDGANLIVHEFEIGVGADLALFDDALASPFTLEVVLNDFAIAYKFAENFMESLGLPTSAVMMKDYTTIDLDGTSGKALGTTSAKQYYIQAFVNGYIMMNSHGENIQYGAAPIQKDFYDLVKAIEGNSDFSKTGTPVSVEMEIDGVRYQNFEFGYVKIVEGVAVYVDGWVVDDQGYQLNRRVGTPLRFINWHWETKNREEYLVGWERLRITQNLRNAIGDLFRAGVTPYKVTESDPFGDAGIHDSSSRAGGSSGVWHIFKQADGWPSLGWGNVFLLQGYWYNLPYVLDPLFNVAEFVDDKGMGRPIDHGHELYNATYQLFDNGIGFFNGVSVEGQPNWVSIKGEDFITWMGAHATVEEALIAHGIAEEKHTVTWLAKDGVTVLKTEQVAHGGAATPPTAPEISGLIFSAWSPEDYNNIVLPNRTFVAIYGSETGEPQAGTYKFVSYESDGSSANFWYENSNNVIQINETLFNAFRAAKLTMAESIVVNGLPIYADDRNLITTLYHFQIDENDTTVVNKLATIGHLDETVTSLQNGNISISLTEKMKLIIQDSFGDAYIFTWDRGEHLLGLPLGPAEIQKLYPNPGVLTEFIDIIVQEFEHGFIMQEAYDNPAYSIYGKTYTEWLALEGFDGLGSPTSREFSYLGVTYQNFKYGYIAIEGEVVTPSFTESNQIDFKGRPIHKLAGRAESRANVRIGHEEFEHELLRIYEEFMKVYTEMKDQGLIFDHAIEMVHEWNGWGITQGFNPSLSTANVWGQANFTHVDMETPYTGVYVIKDDMLTQYAALRGNETFGFPIGNEFEVEVTLEHESKEVKLEVSYQNFTAGYIRAYLVGDVKVLEYFRDAFITEDGVHMVDGIASETPDWDLSGLVEEDGIDKTGLQKKLNDLKAEKDKVKVLVGDITKLPSNQLFVTQELMTEINTKIAEIEALIANEDSSVVEITQALVELDDLITRVKNQSVAGEGAPVDPDDPGKAGLPGWAIAIIVIGSVGILAGVGFIVYTFVIKKHK